MQNQKTRLLLAVFISLLCTLCQAAPNDNLDRLLNVSGLTKQIGGLPDLIKSGFIQGARKNSIPENTLPSIVNSIDQTILPSVILGEIHHSLKASLNKKDIDSLLAWHESTIGKNITTAVEKASTPDAYQYMVSSAQQLLADKQRVAVAERLDKLLDGTNIGMDMQKYTAQAVYSTTMTAKAPNQKPDLDAFHSQMAAMEPQIRQNLHQLMIISAVYSYQLIDDTSLAKYEAFLNRPTKFWKLTILS